MPPAVGVHRTPGRRTQWITQAGATQAGITQPAVHLPRTPSVPYRLNEPDASAEIFDEEVLAINLSNGHYHSIRGTGVAMWKLLIAGYDEEQIVHAMQTAYAAPPATLEADVRGFVQQLMDGGLLVAHSGAVSALAANPPGAPEAAIYRPPIFESHLDMQELLLIDPIHDVDVKVGWPLRASPDEAA